ncbi:hypothetical protein BT67DRAFT_98742 [Trichocladium antarcticum]|uniref:Ankyrin 2,3/unc44 n=1 Tax=Trichocladium antarcticum TaxID=1450529 RepID=A0AAN6UQ89_9PEZI|nr:hypothetical protein BT67DRAFT_98742 [Trichocladium antarcticum]
MASVDTEPPQLRAADVLTLNDAEFDRIMRKIIPVGSNATTEIDAQDWAELSGPDKRKAVQRLRDWMQSANSRPVDLDQVTARLLEARASPALPSSPSSPRSRKSTLCGEEAEEADYKMLIQEETNSYDDLIAHGGRPWYPFRLLDRVSKNHEEYRDLLDFWDPRGWMVYMHQWKRWENFCGWQHDNRGRPDLEADFERDWAVNVRFRVQGGERPSKYDTAESRKFYRDMVSRKRGYDYRFNVEDGVSAKDSTERFEAYVTAMKARLNRHGYGRPFQLDQDHSRQDKLTTWIEYLNYEYWCHDTFIRKAEQLRPRYDGALKALQDGNVLLPDETLETIASYRHGFKREHEKGDARRAVLAAESAVSTAEKGPGLHEQSSHRRRQQYVLEQAQARLDKALETAKAVEKRAGLISDFVKVKTSYDEARRGAEQHKILLRWILDQFPLIETEMAEITPSGSANRKRTRVADDEEASEEVSAKRRKQHDGPRNDAVTRPATRATRSQIMSDDGDQAKSSSEPPPNETAHEQDVKATAERRQPRPKPSSSGPSSDPPPLRRSARIQALRQLQLTGNGRSSAAQGASKAPAESTTRPERKRGRRGLQQSQEPRPVSTQDTSKPSAKSTGKRKTTVEAEEAQKPPKVQRKRRRGN